MQTVIDSAVNQVEQKYADSMRVIIGSIITTIPDAKNFKIKSGPAVTANGINYTEFIITFRVDYIDANIRVVCDSLDSRTVGITYYDFCGIKFETETFGATRKWSLDTSDLDQMIKTFKKNYYQEKKLEMLGVISKDIKALTEEIKYGPGGSAMQSALHRFNTGDYSDVEKILKE